MRKTFVSTILEYSKNNEVPFILTGDLGYSVLEPFRDMYPSKFINVGIMEQSMVSIAAGIASQKNKVFVYSISNFATFRALEQLRIDVGYHLLDVCVVGIGTGFQYGSAGYSHWAIEDLAIMSSLQKFRIFSPSDQFATKNLILDFLTSGGPSYLRLGKDNSSVNSSQIMCKTFGNIKIIGVGKKIIATHGTLANLILQSELFYEGDFSLLIFNEIPSQINNFFIPMFRTSIWIKVIEDVVFPGSLGSRISRFLVENEISKPFGWFGIDGISLESAGGSEEFLRLRELGHNFIIKLFKD